MVAFLDATGEALAAILRPGNAAAGSAEDHVRLLDAALAQLPVDPTTAEVIARTDSAGASHGFVDACRERGVRFIVGHRLSAELARLVLDIPQNRWMSTISADGTEERDAGVVAEITDLVDLGLWPEGTRMLVRREEPHPGAQLTFSDIDGHRYQLFITDHPEDDVAFLEALYRGRGRCERRICDAKDTGLENLPSASFAINEAWLALVLMATDLLAWMRGLCLEGALQKAEPKRLRYTLLHSAGILVRSARRTTLRIAAGWPWADDLVAAFGRLPGWVRSDHLNARRSASTRSHDPAGTSHAPCVSTVALGDADTAYRPANPGQRPRSTGSAPATASVGDVRSFRGELLKSPG